MLHETSHQPVTLPICIRENHLTMSSTTASFEALQSTIISGICLVTVAVITYGIALRYQSVTIAPRCTARPMNVIHAQSNNAWFEWIISALDLQYETMLKGVPNTGAKKVIAMNICKSDTFLLKLKHVTEWCRRKVIECKLGWNCIFEV